MSKSARPALDVNIRRPVMAMTVCAIWAWATPPMAALQAQPSASLHPVATPPAQQMRHISPHLLGQNLADMRPSLASMEADGNYKSYIFNGRVYEHWRVVDSGGIGATLHTVDAMVLGIHITDRAYRTDAGIGVGDTFANVHDAYKDARLVMFCNRPAHPHDYATAAGGQLVFQFDSFTGGSKWRPGICHEGHPEMTVSAVHIRMPDAAGVVPLKYLGKGLLMSDIKDNFISTVSEENGEWHVIDHQRRLFTLGESSCHDFEINSFETTDHSFQIGGTGFGDTVAKIRQAWPHAKKLGASSYYFMKSGHQDGGDVFNVYFHPINNLYGYPKFPEAQKSMGVDDDAIQDARMAISIIAPIPEGRRSKCMIDH